MKKRLKILFLILIITSSCKNEDKISNYNQYEIGNFREELKPHLESLSKEKSLPSKDTIARNYIEKNATTEELIKLLKVSNPLLRIISYRTIVNRQELEYFDLLINHLDDKEMVTWWMADDVVGDYTVSDLMIRKAHYDNVLSTIQKKHLVEKVLLEYSYLDVSDWMIYDIEPEEKYYNLIKERAQTKDKFYRSLSACFALSKFKKEEDVELIKSIFEEKINGNYLPPETIFKSIERFPHQEFYPLLETYFEKYIKTKSDSERVFNDDILFFTRAVSSYKNENALEILKHIEQNNFPIAKGSIPYNKRYVYNAMFTNYDTIYDDLILKIEGELGKCEMERYTSFFKQRFDTKDW